MLICPEWNRPLIVESLTTPLLATHFWCFSGPMNDYVLAPIAYLEETSGAAIKIRINELEFLVPSSWHVLVSDPNTYQLDTVPIAACSNALTHAVAMSPDDSKYRLFPITVIDFEPQSSIVHPMINKGHGLQHPVGLFVSRDKQVHCTVTIGPYDLFKYIENLAVGDIF